MVLGAASECSTAIARAAVSASRSAVSRCIPSPFGTQVRNRRRCWLRSSASRPSGSRMSSNRRAIPARVAASKRRACSTRNASASACCSTGNWAARSLAIAEMITSTCRPVRAPSARAAAVTGSSGASRSPVRLVRGPSAWACRTRAPLSAGDRVSSPASNCFEPRSTYRPGRLRASSSAISTWSSASSWRRARSASRSTSSTSSSARPENEHPASSATAAGTVEAANTTASELAITVIHQTLKQGSDNTAQQRISRLHKRFLEPRRPRQPQQPQAITRR